MKVKQILGIKYVRAKIKFLSVLSSDKAAAEAFRLFQTPQPAAEKPAPPAFSYAEKLFIKINDLRIRGYRWNKGGDKRLLILHGFSSCAFKFHHYILPFIEKGYEVIAFDAPAHGKSEGVTVNAIEYAKMIEKVTKTYGPIHSFLAHSLGGLALCLALEKTGHHYNTRIVLIAPATETTTAINKAFTMLGITNKSVRAAFDKLIVSKTGHTAQWFSIKRMIGKITAPILWIHDETDTITPLSDALAVKALQLPQVQFVITHGLGHRRIYRDEEVKQQVINFL
ncbi:MAG: hypothetical protein RL172_125 [Bacteroidota bacterium]|jgi:alpha-beta hydrolase superfamily lysophospholipase